MATGTNTLLLSAYYDHRQKSPAGDQVLNNDCNVFSFGVHCTEEGDRKRSHAAGQGQALKRENCYHFSGVLDDDCAASDNLLDVLAMTRSPRVPAVCVTMGQKMCVLALLCPGP